MQSETEKATEPKRDIPKNSLLRSFWFAFAGIWYVMRTQRNFRVQICVGAVATAAGLWLRIAPAEWAALLAVMALVYAMEMCNTVAEAIVDMVTQEYHPLAKTAKDVAAGAVLMAALFAIGVGVAIFLPRVVVLLQSMHH